MKKNESIIEINIQNEGSQKIRSADDSLHLFNQEHFKYISGEQKWCSNFLRFTLKSIISIATGLGVYLVTNELFDSKDCQSVEKMHPIYRFVLAGFSTLLVYEFLGCCFNRNEEGTTDYKFWNKIKNQCKNINNSFLDKPSNQELLGLKQKK